MTSLLACHGFCNSVWLLSLRILPNILFTWLCTKCHSYGAFMQFITLRRRSIGSPVHAPTLWTTHLCADLSLPLSCLDSRNRSSCGIWCSSPFTPLGLIAISVLTPNGSKSFWSCPDSTIGTTPHKRRPSTKTSLSTSPGSTKSLELTTFLKNGRKITAWPAKKFLPPLSGKRLNPLFQRK